MKPNRILASAFILCLALLAAAGLIFSHNSSSIKKSSLSDFKDMTGVFSEEDFACAMNICAFDLETRTIYIDAAAVFNNIPFTEVSGYLALKDLSDGSFYMLPTENTSADAIHEKAGLGDPVRACGLRASCPASFLDPENRDYEIYGCFYLSGDHEKTLVRLTDTLL